MVVGLIMCAMATQSGSISGRVLSYVFPLPPPRRLLFPLPLVMPKIARMQVVPARPENSVHSFDKLRIVGGSEPVTNRIWIHAVP